MNPHKTKWSLASLALVTLLASVFSGCIDDPYDANTWIKKLDDVRHWEEAVLKLERLKDPNAIEALGKAWESHNKDGKILRAIISLAELPPEWNGPAWEKAIPTLRAAVDDFDIANVRSLEDARIAADALGRAGDAGAVDTLLRATKSRFPKLSPGQSLRISAIRALGNFGEAPQVVETLIGVLNAPDSDQPPQVNAAAANALAQTKSQKALQPLLVAAYANPAIFSQVRNAISRIGPPAEAPLMQILAGTHTEINALAKEKKFAVNCERAKGFGTDCSQPGVLDFRAAILLGDLRATDAVPALLAKLKSPSKVSLYAPNGAAGPSTHGAVLDALRKIASPKSEAPIYAYMTSATTEADIRPGAIDVYSIIASGSEGVSWLGTQMTSGSSLPVRQASAAGYARLASTKAELAPLDAKITEYRNTAQKQTALAEDGDPAGKSAAERKAAEANDKLSAFEQFRARVNLGIKCKGDAACYAKVLDMKPDEVLAFLGFSPSEIEKLDNEAKNGYRLASLERSLLDIAKLGPGAKAVRASLLKHVDSSERIVRMGALAGLIKGAPGGCSECVERLQEVVDTQGGRNTLADLTVETRVVLNYFLAREKVAQ